jgi:hydrogenase-4 component F
MLLSLILLPLVLAAVTFALPWQRWRAWLLPLGALGHLVLVLAAVLGSLHGPDVTELGGWLILGPLGRLVLPFLGIFFFLCAAYTPPYLALRPERPNRVFCANLFVVLGMMTLVVLSHDLGLMWVAMEAMTLACAPLIYFNHNARSLEATWKYLLVGSVGIALALLGTFFLAYAALRASTPGTEQVARSSTLFLTDLVRAADEGKLAAPGVRPWVHAAFVLLLVGYGAKLGLAPLHTWKPDAYGEAPGVVGALLAGGLTSCAYVALVRCYRVCGAGPESDFARGALLVLGLLSMATGAVFMIRQRDFKRLLAYSSVEHMGILVVGVGLGGIGVYGSLLHLVNNGLTKGVLFLSAGNIHRAYGSKLTPEVQGALRRVPLSGALFLAGFLAITGSPPFGPFISEFTIASAALSTGRYLAGGLFLVLLLLAFLGIGATVLAVVQGVPSLQAEKTLFHDRLRTALPILVLLVLVLMLGVYMPPELRELLEKAADTLEVKR